MADLTEMYCCPTSNCGYIYNPSKGDKKNKVAKGTKFDELPEDWKCPCCGVGTKVFKPLQEK